MKNNKFKLSYILIFLCGFLFSCSSDNDPIEDVTYPDIPSIEKDGFAKGADVSWITEFEALGYKFYNANNQPVECMSLLKNECGVNSIRLRVWVNPVRGWNNIDDVVVKARRAASLGMRIMIDFHYSDHWADPSQQETPDAWKNMNISELCNAVTEHTKEMLLKLKVFGVTPEWVQVGNEIPTGFLYPLGQYINQDNFTALINAGYDASKSIFPNVKVIVHLDSGQDLYRYTRIFDILKNKSGKYDMIGMSLYPDADNWKSFADQCISNINTLYSVYGKNVMICEIGMNYKEGENCNKLISYLMENGGSHLKGIFYWEPECPAEFGYDKGCFENGRPTVALDSFK